MDFEEIMPDVIVITGCARSPLEDFGDKAAYMVQEFFNNVYNGLRSKNGSKQNVDVVPYILCTNIDWYKYDGIGTHQSGPFYGDIRLRNHSGKAYLSYSYKGMIHTFIKTASEDDTIDFKTIKSEKKLLSQTKKTIRLQDTEWFSKVGFVYGGE